MTTAKKSKTTKATKTNTKTKTNPTALVKKMQAESQTKMAIWKQQDIANESVMKSWGSRLKQTKIKMKELEEITQRITLRLLMQAYSVYNEVVKTELADEFFGAVWSELYKEGVKVQSNTPNASLVIRYICPSSISTKTISNYAKVLEAADYNKIKPEQFVEWVNHKTMTRVIEDQRNIENNKETREEKLARARAVIMRLIEVRETKPEHSWKTTAWSAEKQISKKGLWVGIGNAHRVLDGGSNFNASMNLVMMLPLNVDMEKYILNTYARVIVDSIDKHEKTMNELEEKVWADKLWEQLVSATHEESIKQDEYWSDRMQAARYEEQKDFIKEISQPKSKARLKKKKQTAKKPK
jgi:hypothetical protein